VRAESAHGSRVRTPACAEMPARVAGKLPAFVEDARRPTIAALYWVEAAEVMRGLLRKGLRILSTLCAIR